MGVVALIVLEPGSDWPCELGGDYDHVIALANDAATLLERTRECLATLAGGRDRLGTAVLACCAAAHDATSRRTTIARTLFEALEAAGNGRLVLSTGANAPLSLRDEVRSLAATIGGRNETTVWVRPEERRGAEIAPLATCRAPFEPMPASA